MRTDTATRRDLARALDRIKRLDPRAAELALVELERLRRQAARYRLELRECQALVARRGPRAGRGQEEQSDSTHRQAGHSPAGSGERAGTVDRDRR